MGHNRLFELSVEPFKSSADHLTDDCLETSDFPSSCGVDYFLQSESTRNEDLQWLQMSIPYAKVTSENGQDILHVDREFRDCLRSKLLECMNEATMFLSQELRLELDHINFSMMKARASAFMQSFDILLYMDYIQTDFSFWDWLTANPEVDKLYIGGIIDFHY